MRNRLATMALAFICALSAAAAARSGGSDEDDWKAAVRRMEARFPQPVRVGDLIGLPINDDDARTLGYVRHVARSANARIELIVAYGGLFGFGTRLVAVPIEFVGIAGRQLSSLDMPRADYAKAPIWADATAVFLPDDTTIRIALSRH